MRRQRPLTRRQVFHERRVVSFNQLIQKRLRGPMPSILARPRSPSTGVRAGQLGIALLRCLVRFSGMTIGLYETLTHALPSMVMGNTGRIRIPRGFYTPGFWTAFACRALQQRVPAEAIRIRGQRQ